MLDFSQKKITTIIVEDNVHSLNEFKELLSEYENIEIIGEAENGRAAIDIIDKLKPDLIFLDIQLPELNGFEVLRNLQHRPMVIFASAYDQYAVKAFDANGVDYILKPVLRERLEIALEKVVNHNKKPDLDIMQIVQGLMEKKNREKRFAIKLKEQILIIPQEDVYYFKAEDKYVFLNIFDNHYFYNATLKKLSDELDPDLFVRINKSCIVSLDKITKLKRNFKREYSVVLSDEKKTAIKISKNYLTKMKKKLNI